MSIRLVTKDNKNINVSVNEILDFKIITDMLEIYDIDKSANYEIEDTYEIPLDITYNTLKKILEFSSFETKNVNIHIHEKSVFYSKYFEMKDEELFDVINSADYLNYDYLIDKACDKLSDDILSCNSVDELKKKFKITREFTKEEENEILNYSTM